MTCLYDARNVARAVAYERRRADHAGLDLETHLARKIERTPLAVTVEELIAACEERDSLVVPTARRLTTALETQRRNGLAFASLGDARG